MTYRPAILGGVIREGWYLIGQIETARFVLGSWPMIRVRVLITGRGGGAGYKKAKS